MMSTRYWWMIFSICMLSGATALAADKTSDFEELKSTAEHMADPAGRVYLSLPWAEEALGKDMIQRLRQLHERYSTSAKELLKQAKTEPSRSAELLKQLKQVDEAGTRDYARLGLTDEQEKSLYGLAWFATGEMMLLQDQPDEFAKMLTEIKFSDDQKKKLEPINAAVTRLTKLNAELDKDPLGPRFEQLLAEQEELVAKTLVEFHSVLRPDQTKELVQGMFPGAEMKDETPRAAQTPNTQPAATKPAP